MWASTVLHSPGTKLTITCAPSRGLSMTDPGSSAETAGLLRARGWSVRLLLLASVIVLAGVIYNIWSTVGFMQHGGEALSAQSDADGVDLSERTVTFLLYGCLLYT